MQSEDGQTDSACFAGGYVATELTMAALWMTEECLCCSVLTMAVLRLADACLCCSGLTMAALWMAVEQLCCYSWVGAHFLCQGT
jgi:hypothetical protein